MCVCEAWLSVSKAHVSVCRRVCSIAGELNAVSVLSSSQIKNVRLSALVFTMKWQSAKENELRSGHCRS